MSEPVRRRRVWRYVLGIALILVVIAGLTAAIFARHLTPIVRQRALDMLRSRFDSEAAIGELDVSLWHGIVVTGKHLVVRHHGRTD